MRLGFACSRILCCSSVWKWKHRGILPLFTLGLIASIAKEDAYFGKSANLPPHTIKKEFGADRGVTALVKGNRSDFAKGYALVALVLLHKIGKGLAILYFLYNGSRELELDGLDFSRAYYCLGFE